ncbi:ABC transporter ATP-binding protein [Acidithiobacillus concretivorus]|uniref:ATP-binding cassette domain-containing protein n=1 Tax=Acidithiobacillus concretivorus TaxID=3063952 RepID=A0ABS5ZQ91_9PROT|nr:ATP-binding cassette domain-containing protein [Acidithiobacillus concretivorus]MBU2738348.1 ATP-binding cassette domain-containing protein [Acidithiobacillus concretivorus]
MERPDAIIMEKIGTRFGDYWIHRNLDLTVHCGEILAIVGGSGTGKTTLLRAMMGLVPIADGKLTILGKNPQTLTLREQIALRQRWGVLFQQGALFSALTVFENIAFPLREWGHLTRTEINDLVALKLQMVGLQPKDAWKLPAELSGGMIKRVALARALAMEAEILFLDEPTSGLDPIAASDFDALLRQVHADIGFTVVMVSHDLDSLAATASRVAVLADHKVLTVGPLNAVQAVDHPYIQAFFHGERGERLLNSLRATGKLPTLPSDDQSGLVHQSDPALAQP